MAGEDSESHRLKITPEQRRVLGPARSREDWGKRDETESRPASKRAPESSAATEEASAPTSTSAEPMPSGRPLREQSQLARLLELQNVALIFGGLLLLFVVFYAGRKFDYWRYQFMTNLRAKNLAAQTDRFPNASAGDLIEQAIVDERIGNWKDAADRYVAAKQRSLTTPGLLFRAAKIYYDHGGFDPADRLFDRAIAFGEQPAEANYYRAMIANGRGDYAAAARFYEAAANAAPFNADYFYSWAETLRRDHRLQEAIARYGQAALRGHEAEENICRYKIRMTMIEAGDAPKVNAELQNRHKSGPLSVDWLMTQAGLQIQTGEIDDAARTIRQAHDADTALLFGHFAACASDRFFSDAAVKYPQINDALKISTTR